ncbi:hypothetical protein [Spirosoma foliorum]|uniref:CN hydrolase domain-containing protein n=1 Tax=Spirosoma foliorum TaxID=2710596 RepID=A0A7G5GTJ6_9BACT|nr:hypothetical protein [Spirosoma foliorum]QMW02188.1 hypothetical protein H3H32_30385 [Spirosoma foliorum]
MSSNLRKYSVILYIVFLLNWGAFGLWFIWLNGEPLKPDKPAKISHIEQFGNRSDRGNLLGIQPWMTPIDYQNGLTFREKIAGYLQTAKDSGLITPKKTIVILPEYLG